VGIKIPFAADTSDFLRGTDDLGKALDDVADSLDDLSKAGSDVDEKVGGDLEAVGLAADAAAEKVEQSFKSAFDAVAAQGRTSTSKVKADVDDVGSRGSATLQEFSAEAKANVAETVSSFDGSASSAVDAIQGTFGGLVSALGPAGVVGVAAAGLGIGMAKSLFAKSAEAAEALREQISGIFDELRSNEGVLTKAFQADQIADLIDDTERIKDIFGVDLPTAAKVFGDDFDTMLQGLTGGSEDAAAASDLLQKRWQEAVDSGQTYVDEGGNVILANQDMAKSYGGLLVALKDQGAAVEGGTTAYQIYADATKGMTEATEDSTEAVEDETRALEENRGLKVDAAAATLDMKDAIDDATQAIKDNGTSLSDNTRKGRDNRRNIIEAIEAINGWGQAQVDAGADVDSVNRRMKEQRDALVETLVKLGLNRTAVEKYIDKLGGIPAKKKTDVEVTDNGSIASTQRDIDNIKSSGVPVPVEPDMRGFDASVRKYLNGKSYHVQIAPRTGKSVPT